MAGPITGYLASVAWGSSTDFVTDLVQNNNAGAEFSLDFSGDSFDATRFNSPSAIWKRNVKGLRSGKGQIKCFYTTPAIGSQGLVTYSSGYTLNTAKFKLNIKAEEHDVTAYNATAPEVRSFIPGLCSYSASWEGYADNATYLAAPSLDAEPASASLQLIGGSGGKTIGVSLITTGLGVTVSPAAPNGFRYSAVGDGQPTVTGTGTLFADADAGGGVYTLTRPETGKSLVLTSYTSQTYTGNAFWTGIDIDHSVDGLVVITVDFRYESTLPSNLTGD